MKSILFVCAANRCRSVMAEALFRREIGRRSRLAHMTVGSAGTIANDDCAAEVWAVQVCHEAGLDIERNLSRELTPELAESADLVVTLTQDITQAARAIAPNANIKMLGELVGTGSVVRSPHGDSATSYRRCLQKLDGMISALADRLQQVCR